MTKHPRLNRTKQLMAVILIGLLSGAGYATFLVKDTTKRLEELHYQARSIGTSTIRKARQEALLPMPVKRYLEFVFRGQEKPVAYVELDMTGDFRRPLTEHFEPTTARQTLIPNIPALVFEAHTPIAPGLSATVYDAFLNGEMEMKAKLLSLITVVDEQSSPELDRISLRRWLLEAPLFPQALRPSQYLRWEAMDATHARAVASYRGLSTSLVATFAEDDGRLLSMHAETNGDLTTPYHGSGEFVSRSDYRQVDGIMIPFQFSIARMANQQTYPFWRGVITDYRVTYQTPGDS